MLSSDFAILDCSVHKTADIKFDECWSSKSRDESEKGLSVYK